jgi:hypothetical protein
MRTVVTLNGRRIAEMNGTPEQAQQKVNAILRQILNGSLLIGVLLALYIFAHLQ